jgi:YVTN family beta-propeller protein
MKKYIAVIAIVVTTQLQAQYQADKIYTANQVSNTVSVIDPQTNRLLGELVLGKPQPNIFSALYKGQALVHGMGYSAKRKLLAVVSIGSNAVTFISTKNDSVIKTLYIGRSPHEATFTTDGKQVWVTVRGEAYISVIDANKMVEVKRVAVADGPGMVAFTPDGKWAYICSSFTAELDVVNTATYQVIKRIPVVSPFSPNIFCSYDGRWMAMTHKDIGKTTLIDTKTMTVLKVLSTGAISNHVTFTNTKNPLMLVTVGGENKVRVYDVNKDFTQTESITTGSLPHGIWTSADGKFAYVGLENDDKVNTIDIEKRKVIATIPIGNAPQALVYASNATNALTSKAGNLTPLNDNRTQVIKMKANDKSMASGAIVARNIGLADLLQINFKNLQPNEAYSLALTKSADASLKDAQVLTEFKADAKGMYSGQSTGVIKTLDKAALAEYHHIVLYKKGEEKVVLVNE